MTRTRPFGVRALSGIAALSLAATGLAVIAASPAAAAPAVVYDSIPDPLPPAYSSLGFQATSTSAFGDYIQLGGDNRVITEVTVGLTNWACENWETGANPCVTTPGSSFEHPITLNIYDVDNTGATPAPGDLIASVTEEKTIPFRPSANTEECGDNRWYSDVTETCYNGYNLTATFDGLNAVAGNDVIISVAYNTQSYGSAPIGVNGPYNSLNVSLVNAAPSVGAVETYDEMFWDSTYLGRTPGLTIDTGWASFFGLALEITADSVPAIDPLTQVTVYERDVKPNETPETYTEWHEGQVSDRSTVFEDGLHLGIGGPSTVIKGTDLTTPEAVASNTVTREQLRLLVERASVDVVSGTVTYQVPVFFGNPLSPSFTTLRSTSLAVGSNTISQADTWATTRAFGPYGVQETAPLGELIDALFDAATAAGGGVVIGGYGVQADTLAVVSSVVWNDTRYTFTQPVIEACTPTLGTEVTNLALGGWDFSQTRSQGTNVFTEEGLVVTTFGEPGTLGQAKAAGYAPIDIALSEVGSVGLEIAPGFTGTRPSLQLGFDADGVGGTDAYLVGEPWANGGGDWSLTVNGDWADANFWSFTDFGVGPGLGYDSLGTLDDYLIANPEARITEYGYSLGSGVTGSATIESITVGCVTTPFGFELETLPAPTTDRLAGGDRYATAVEISKAGFADGEPDTVFIATGTVFADALSAAPAAAELNAPLLLTIPTRIPDVVLAELNRLAPSEIVIVGSTLAVSAAVEAALEGLAFAPEVTRVFGSDRYATSRAVSDFAFDTATTAFLATGVNFPDALAAGPAAAELGGPVVLIPGLRTTVDAATTGLLDELGVTDVLIAGSNLVVSDAIETALDADYTVTRLEGPSRYDTAIAINEFAFTDESVAYLATGQGFADALAGGALAANQGVPLYISLRDCLDADVLQSMVDLGVTNIVLLGGLPALSLDVENLVLCGAG